MRSSSGWQISRAGSRDLRGPSTADCSACCGSRKSGYAPSCGDNLPIFPQTSQELPKLEARIDWLVQRVELTSRVGDLLNEMDMNEESLAVPEVDAIRIHCREVLDIVRKSTAAADEIQSAQKHAQLAEEIRDRADDEPSAEAIQELRNRASAVSARVPNPLPPNSGWVACADLLTALQKDLPPAGAIDRPRFVPAFSGRPRT